MSTHSDETATQRTFDTAVGSPEAEAEVCEQFTKLETNTQVKLSPEQESPELDSQLFTLYVSKLDAGVAILLTHDHYLIEFPSVLLPESTKAGSIVQISATRSFDAEKLRQEAFEKLQATIMAECE